MKTSLLRKEHDVSEEVTARSPPTRSNLHGREIRVQGARSDKRVLARIAAEKQQVDNIIMLTLQKF